MAKHVAQLLKQAGIFDAIGRAVQPAIPKLTNSTVAAVKGLRNLANATSLGAGTARESLNNAAKAVKGFGGQVAGADPATIGKYTAGGAAGLGALGAYGAMKDQPEEPMQVQAAAEASVGTPFVDGVLAYCIERDYNATQVVDLLEKGASAEGKTGQECKDFLDRLAAVK